MSGYKGKEEAKPQVAKTPALEDARRKENLREYSAKVGAIKDEAIQAHEKLVLIEQGIAQKRADFAAEINENNSALQSIQAQIRTAGEALSAREGVFKEHVEQVEADIKERIEILTTRTAACIEAQKTYKQQSVDLTVSQKRADDLIAALERNRNEADEETRLLRTMIREQKDLLESIKQDSAALKVRGNRLDDIAIGIDTVRVKQSTENSRIDKRIVELNQLILTSEVSVEELEKIDEKVKECDDQLASHNERQRWLADKKAELHTYERALRVRDAQIQEREGKVKTAEKDLLRT